MSLWRGLNKIQGDLHARFVYVPDKDRYGKREYWARPNESEASDGKVYGDCEDFALAAQSLCVGAGILNSRLVVCNVPKRGGHCVLEVEGFILDNRMKGVVSQEELDYEWLKIQDHDGRWRAIK